MKQKAGHIILHDIACFFIYFIQIFLFLSKQMMADACQSWKTRFLLSFAFCSCLFHTLPFLISNGILLL